MEGVLVAPLKCCYPIQMFSSVSNTFIGYIDVGGGCWRRLCWRQLWDVVGRFGTLTTVLRCWLPIRYIKKHQHRKNCQHSDSTYNIFKLSPSKSRQHHCESQSVTMFIGWQFSMVTVLFQVILIRLWSHSCKIDETGLYWILMFRNKHAWVHKTYICISI